jgi:hypothetical protein
MRRRRIYAGLLCAALTTTVCVGGDRLSDKPWEHTAWLLLVLVPLLFVVGYLLKTIDDGA